jgi:hypothetical protein
MACNSRINSAWVRLALRCGVARCRHSDHYVSSSRLASQRDASPGSLPLRLSQATGLYYPWNVNTYNDMDEIVAKLVALREEHRDLDLAIERLAVDPGIDQLQLTRLKKRKLKLKDQISYFESRLIPDMDA